MFRFSVRNLLRQLVPSRVLEFFVDSSATSSSHFVEYDSWDEAVAASEGWDSKLIVDKLRDATMQVVQGEKTYERDSILFDRVSYSFPLLSSILLAAATSAGPLRIIDFGGGLGTSFRQNEAFLSRLKIPLEWRVVELPKMVEIGRSTFSTSQLSFHETIEQAGVGGADLVIFSGVAQYLNDPSSVFSEAKNIFPRYLVLDRTPVRTGVADRVGVSKAPPSIYEASYPMRLFSYDNLLSNFSDGYELVAEWASKASHPATTTMGFLFERQ